MTAEKLSRPSTSPQTAARMSRQATRDTAPELALRRELHRRGLRYCVDHPLPNIPRRRADITFTKARVVVFVDGCFWHMCPEHHTLPTTNAQWWRRKLEGNVERDRQTDTTLMEAGWTVLRFWEHMDVTESANVVEQAVRLPNDAEDRRTRRVAQNDSKPLDRDSHLRDSLAYEEPHRLS